MWLRKKPKTEVAIRYYTRAACPLCDEGRALLDEALRKSGRRARIERIDVDTDPALVERFGDRVPVVEIAGRVRCWGRLSKALLVRELRVAP